MLRKIWTVSVLSVSAAASLLLVVGHVRSKPLAAPPVFTVTSIKDEVDATPGDGQCDSAPSGVCTLRAAIMEANRLTGTTIILPSGIYSLTIHWAGIDDEDSGDLNIKNSMVISGAGAATTIIDANGAVIDDRVMQVYPTTSLVTISGVTIRGGHIVDYPGGAIETEAALTLRDCIIRDNSSKGAGGGGGAIATSLGGHLTLDHCIVTHNVTDQTAGAIRQTGQSLTLMDTDIVSNSGALIGGIYSDGNLTMIGGNVLSNTSSSEGGGLYVEAYTTATLAGVDIGANSAITGGGILNYGVLALSASSVHDNSAQAGGGLYMSEDVGAVTIHNTTFTHNNATQNGGGIYKDHGSIKLNLDHMTLSDNTSGSQGGGIYLYDSYSPIPIDHSTLDHNSADGNGGGLFIATGSTVYITNTTFYFNQVDTTSGQQGGGIYNGGALYLTNSTLDDNFSTHAGGGLFNANSAFARLFNTTIAHNNSGTDYGGFPGNDVPGGGIANSGTGVVSVTDSLIADNTRELSDIGFTQVPDDCYGTLKSVQGYNLIGTTTGCAIVGTLTGVISNTDPQLDVPQNNGGVNQTDALVNGSPAINAGNPTGCRDNWGTVLATDQRGYYRNGRCDIGAFEFDGLLKVFLPVVLKSSP